MKPKIVTVHVTREHIRKGEPDSPVSCPIALAIEGKGFNVDGVDCARLTFEDSEGNYIILNTSGKLATFIRRFDDGKPVKPLKFRFSLPLTIPAKLL
jgi:hypothetical protein